MFLFLIKTNYYFLKARLDNITKKRVCFSDTINYIPIPNIDYYIRNNLIDDMWWSENELKSIQKYSCWEFYKMKKLFTDLTKKDMCPYCYKRYMHFVLIENHEKNHKNSSSSNNNKNNNDIFVKNDIEINLNDYDNHDERKNMINLSFVDYIDQFKILSY